MKNHLSDDAPMPVTVVNPPPIQEMSSNNDQGSAVAPPAPASKDPESNNLEMQPL